jgi:hypothetical protein
MIAPSKARLFSPRSLAFGLSAARLAARPARSRPRQFGPHHDRCDNDDDPVTI